MAIAYISHDDNPRTRKGFPYELRDFREITAFARLSRGVVERPPSDCPSNRIKSEFMVCFPRYVTVSGVTSSTPTRQ